MKIKHGLLSATVFSIVVAQPAMALSLAEDKLNEMIFNSVIPGSMIMSFVLAITIFCSGQRLYLQRGSDPEINKDVMILAFMSLFLASVPSLALSKFGTGNIVLLLINGLVIVYGLMLRSQ